MPHCSIRGKKLADSPLTGLIHARKHRNAFEQAVGRRPKDYDEVREFFGGEGAPEVASLDEFGGLE